MATVNPEVFKKFKNANKLPTRQEGDGHEIEIEVREDEEQSVKLQEIIDLLVAAGYFRARIKGLSPFDKVVGGMTWCIESCNVDVDVDLLFQENSTIGQKIALTEKIVAVLPKIKCPHRIEPHQIQGLDFIHIYPVIQWLVKRSMEYRQEMSVFVRSYADNQFNKQFDVKDKDSEIKRHVLENINTVSEIYRPQRYYKRKNAPPPDFPSRVQITLLEYDHRGGNAHGTGSAAGTSGEGVLEKQQAQEEIVDYEDLNEEEKQRIKKHYASLHSELKDGGQQSREEIQSAALNEQKYILTERCNKFEAAKLSIEDELKQNTAALQDIRLKQQEADKALKELERTEASDPESVKEVEELVILNDNLKAQEIQFREYCKQELARLQKLIDDTKKTKAKTPSEADGDLNTAIGEELEKVRVLRLQVAKKNRHVASLQRQLDDVPNRAELAQYQRRFLELYNQVAAKHKETKQYYTLYNTLEDTRMYMQKELSLLNSISDSYPEAVRSSGGKEEFLKQFQNIVDSVRQSKFKVERKLIEERQKRDQLGYTLQGLVELQRKYVAAVRQLSVECRKHEAVLAQSQRKS
ncbi:coiled-coil domain-containing protein 93 isoform X2 [Anoplophora glabripennis]|uniref:coiled-coil domain-containing protein 93 isoform X2 n=1 Tax=Anoplophora glabripennis TaxID=217634 RepID=UPI00087524D5|nr:coiled-coil domain-containing protein 93 isoform X2 [Anoplophora glabripennis]